MCEWIVATAISICMTQWPAALGADLFEIYDQDEALVTTTSDILVEVPCPTGVQRFWVTAKLDGEVLDEGWTDSVVCRKVSPDYNADGIVGLPDFSGFFQNFSQGVETLTDLRSFAESFGCQEMPSDRECS